MKDETLLPEKMTADYAWGNLGVPAEDCSAWANGWNARAALQSGNSGQPVTVPDEKLPLDYLQGQKDGLEWAAQMAEANHPETGDWLYDDPIELAKAIRKGPDMPESFSDGWIPVSERMPAPGRWLALYGAPVYTRGPDAGKPWRKFTVGEGYLDKEDGKFYLLNWESPGEIGDSYNNLLAIATHWMYWELPDAPKGITMQSTNVTPDERLQKAIVDACTVFLHGCDGLSKNYECDFGDAETEHSFCMAEVAKKAGVVEETGNRRWSLCKEMKDEIEAVYRKYAMRIMEAAPKAAHFRENENSSTKLFREIGETSTKCWCRTCRPVTISDMRFVVCPDCGNKRCPKANDHRNACTGSNEPGQEGSAYPDAPKVKP